MALLEKKNRGFEIATTALSIAAIIVLCHAIVHDSRVVAAIVAFLPLVALLFVLAFDDKRIPLLLLIIISFFIPVAGHYIFNAPLGVVLDALIVYNIFIIICNLLTKRVKFTNVSYDVIFVVGLWFIYCLLEVFNPKMIAQEAWISSMRGMAIYFFFVILITQIAVESFRDYKIILYVISVMILISVGKALWQKMVGFTQGDKFFLYVMDGKRTHIIHYGIRYFSIFSDAANYGGCMGMSTAIFLILGFHTKQRFAKLYWWFVSLASCYGMFISGTRSALVVPVAAIMLYLFLIRDWKKMIPTGILLGTIVCILAFTTIGDQYTYIQRARTIFHKDEDLSYLGRLGNREVLKEYMKDLPFGNSLGMSAGRGKAHGDTSPIADIPTDSWYVQIWVETGVVGLVLYFLVMAYLFIKGGIIVFFRLKDPEIKGYTAGLLSGIAGLFVMSSNSEVFSQIPNGVLVYTFFGLIFLSPIFDREAQAKAIAENEQQE